MKTRQSNKAFCVVFIALNLAMSSQVFSKPVSIEQVRGTTDSFLHAQEYRPQAAPEALDKSGGVLDTKELTIPVSHTLGQTKEIVGDDGTILAYVTELEPEGFIITAGDSDTCNLNSLLYFRYFAISDTPCKLGHYNLSTSVRHLFTTSLITFYVL